MQQYLEILQTCRLFAEIPPDSLKTMLECFAPTIQTYAKQQTLLYAGEPLHQLGIVLTGKVQLVRLDYDGNRSITASLSPAQPFGEAFVCAGVDAAPISVIGSHRKHDSMAGGRKTSASLLQCLRFSPAVAIQCHSIAGKKKCFVSSETRNHGKTYHPRKTACLSLSAGEAGKQQYFCDSI